VAVDDVWLRADMPAKSPLTTVERQGEVFGRRPDRMLRCFANNTRGWGFGPWGIALNTTNIDGTRTNTGLSTWRSRRLLAAVAVAVTAVATGGCGMSSLTSGLGGGMFGGSSSKTDATSVSEDQLLSAAKANDPSSTGSTAVGEVSAGCPRFVIAPRDNNITFYEPGRAGDGLAILHRGEITKTARECQIEPGRVTVKFGFSGRVLLGPKGKPGPISLPLNVSVNDSKRAKVAGDSVKVDVMVEADKPIGYFSAVRTVTFDVPEGSRAGEFEVMVGFDNKAAGAG
jgi:hypothetical protein